MSNRDTLRTAAAPTQSLLRFFLRRAPEERQRLFILTIVVGIVCGVVAVAFHLAIRALEQFFFRNAVELSWVSALVLISIPTIGGLLGGILLTRFPAAQGSGIPQVKQAYAEEKPLTLRDAGAKFVASLIHIGSGLSLGREGPTVYICAGIASAFGRVGALSRKGMRRLLPVGAAAGVAAAFNAPIAAVTFAIEEIVGDLDQAVLAGVVIAAALAAAIERSIIGAHPAFELHGEYALGSAMALPFYALLGVLAAVVAVAFTDSMLDLRQRFRESVVPRWARPAIGGALTGIFAVVALAAVGNGGIVGGGYDTLSVALSGSMALRVVAVLCLLKLAATAFAYASGASGGIFAPSLFIGGMLGAAVGHLHQFAFPATAETVGSFALVGMGAVFAGIIRAPITSVLIIFEMTDGYSLILPLMIANMSAYALAKRWRPVPIYDALLAQDGIFLSRSSDRELLSRTPAGAIMTTKVVAVVSGSTVNEALERITAFQFALFPVIEGKGRFVGFLNRFDLQQASSEGRGDDPIDSLVRSAPFVHPETSASEAAVVLDRLRTHMVAVVRNDDERHFLGLLTSSDLVRAQADLSRDATDSNEET